jgi:hypothetical protein
VGPCGHEERGPPVRHPAVPTTPVSPACGPREHVAPPNVTSGDGEREERGGSGHFALSDWLGGCALWQVREEMCAGLAGPVGEVGTRYRWYWASKFFSLTAVSARLQRVKKILICYAKKLCLFIFVRGNESCDDFALSNRTEQIYEYYTSSQAHSHLCSKICAGWEVCERPCTGFCLPCLRQKEYAWRGD